jgi:hypothetical protein
LRAWLPGLLALVVLLLIYSGTLQRDVNGSGSGYMLDVGEIQVALNLWGTVHYTGYPLFTVLGASLTHALRAVGLSPAGAASAVATLWSLLGLAGVYGLLLRVTEGERGLAALVVLALGLIETFWVHSVVAEVYSLGLFLTSLTLLAAMKLADGWNERYWWLMVALLGIGVSHHRLLVLLLPAVLLLIWPVLWERRSRWLALGARSLALFALPFLAYLYLPLRAIQGARWVYGQPGTWDGFWVQFLGGEMTPFVLGLPRDLATWIGNLRFLADQLLQQAPVLILVAGGAGLVWLAVRRLWMGLAFLGGVCAALAFVVVFPLGVWAPAVLMPVLLFWAIGLAYLLHRLAKAAPPLRWVSWVSLVALAVWFFRTNLPFVYGLVHDDRGREVIRMLQPLKDADLPGGRNVVALPWGGDYFAAAYGLYVTGNLAGFDLVDHRVDFRSLVQREGKVITLASDLGYWPLYWWSDRLGEAHYSSAAPGVAMVSRDVLYGDIPVEVGFDLGNGVRVRDAVVFWQERDTVRVTVFWEAVRQVPSDYSVAVHLVSRDPPQGGEDIVAQADALNPVGGWYPTSRWSPGEVVRDDYALTVPPGSSPVAVRIAMYQVDPGGGFVNTDWLSLPVP